MVLYGTLWYGMGAYYRWLFSTDGCFAPICRKGGPYAYCTPEPTCSHLHANKLAVLAHKKNLDLGTHFVDVHIFLLLLVFLRISVNSSSASLHIGGVGEERHLASGQLIEAKSCQHIFSGHGRVNTQAPKEP